MTLDIVLPSTPETAQFEAIPSTWAGNLSVPNDQIHTLPIRKTTLLRDGPVLFVETFHTSYDRTPYLAIDQLASVVKEADPKRDVLRLQIHQDNDKSELMLWIKNSDHKWELSSALVALDDFATSKLNSQYYHEHRGSIQYGRSLYENQVQTNISNFATSLGLACREDQITVNWGHSQSGNLETQFGNILRKCNPAIIACTGDSKVFSPMRRMLRLNYSSLENRLLVLGGIHANAAHFAIRAQEADSIKPLFDLVHRGTYGEKDFKLLLEAFNLDESQRYTELANLVNFTSCRIDTTKTPWLTSGPVEARLNQGIPKCPSAEQFPTAWGTERPIIRRVKGATGCQFTCSFCATAGNYQAGDINAVKTFFDSVMEEVAEKEITAGDLLVYFEDANFAGGFARKVLELSSTYPFKLGVQIRYDCIKPLLPSLKSSHTDYLFLGMESYEDALRDGVHKLNSLSPQDMYEIAAELKSHQIDYLISGIVGLPGEDKLARARTIAFMRLQAPEIISIEVPKVYPATPFAEEYERITGLDPAALYTSGEGLVETGAAGKETKGSLLHHSLNEQTAVAVMQEMDRMMLMPFKSLWEMTAIDTDYTPLGTTDYIRDSEDLGFYRRTRKI